MFVSFGVGIIFVSALASLDFGEKITCKNFVDGSCIFVKIHGWTDKNEPSQLEAKNACKLNNYTDYSWDLPTTDQPDKEAKLYEILLAMVKRNEQPVCFWIRLKRDTPNTFEATNLSEWKNPNKWSWGNSTLANWPDDVYDLPWAPDQPNNARYQEKNDHSLSLTEDTERCVMVAQNETTAANSKTFYWYDTDCDVGLLRPDYSFALVCEGTPLPATKPPNYLKHNGSPTTQTTPFPWPWLVGGLAVASVLLTAAAVVVAVYVRRRRRTKLRKMHHHRRTRTDVPSSRSRRTPSARTRTSRRRNVVSSGSRRHHQRGNRFSRHRSDKKPTKDRESGQ